MSKRFKGQTCVYCAVNLSVTGDHVFARKLFAENRRDNLPQVPVCDPCNNAKSELETYLSTALVIGGQHPDAEAMMKTLPDKLARNQKLRRELAEGARPTVIDEPPPRPGMIPMQFRFRGQTLLDLLAYAAKGLLWHHWQVLLPPECIARPISLTRSGESLLASLVDKYAHQTLRGNLGEGTILYEGAQGREYPELSFWGFIIYGGLRLHGESAAASTSTRYQAVVTGRADMFSDPELAKLLR
ncbi:MAG: HNH endonuclease [Gammaproteobacteria bacterium]